MMKVIMKKRPTRIPVKVQEKGGPGSGNWGHAGRPGMVGGSSSAAGVGTVTTRGKPPELMEIDFFSGKPISPMSSEAKAWTNEVIDSAIKTTNVDMSEVGLAVMEDKYIMGDVIGSFTSVKQGPLRGKLMLVVSTRALEEAIQQHGADSIKNWNGVFGEPTKENLFKHVLAHEIGHRWLEQQPHNTWTSWHKVFTENQKDMSQYSRHYQMSNEGLADAYAGFVLGYPQSSTIENWFLENT